MIKKIRRRLSGRGGFSFAEFMIAILILMLVGGLVTSSLGLGMRQFQTRSHESEAELLLNTLTTAVRDELSAVSGTVTMESGTNRLLTFTSNAYDADMLRCSFVTGTYIDAEHITQSATGEIMLEFNYVDGTVFYYPLLNAVGYAGSGDLTAGMTTTCDTVNHCFNVELTVYAADGVTALSSRSFTVTPILSVNGL